ncbi:hypothetical protein D1819_16355 [Pseudoalteromonas tunicata]|jgi:hypothetical protein|uniref:Uncharacterized protein n=1 Tax=Pseudoalteromonas tunicata D2 TaxID=87626 RepID=A4C7V2_9GAMM|nr:hypothetical protein D1819_16355 [Pseudoalteromonas tunicata]EAR28667.1 hypothetical protein PTD2_06484 [Pseudoalteromonas tunicata D2]
MSVGKWGNNPKHYRTYKIRRANGLNKNKANSLIFLRPEALHQNYNSLAVIGDSRWDSAQAPEITLRQTMRILGVNSPHKRSLEFVLLTFTT